MEIQNSTRISVNNHFDDIVKMTFVFDDNDVTDYINDYLRAGAIDWVMSKIDVYDPNRGVSLDNYIIIILKNYMNAKHWDIRKNVEFRDLVLRPYYREKKLMSILG